MSKSVAHITNLFSITRTWYRPPNSDVLSTLRNQVPLILEATETVFEPLFLFDPGWRLVL